MLMFDLQKLNNGGASGISGMPLGKDFQERLEEVIQLAEKGDPDAAFVLISYLQMNGETGNSMRPEHVAWLRTAAEAGITPAMPLLARVILSQSAGAAEDAKAAELYRVAAERDSGEAIRGYSRLLISGRGVAKDLNKARQLRQKSAGGSEEEIIGRVKRVQADMRAFGTAVESYFVDNNCYPAMTRDASLSVNSDLAKDAPEVFRGIAGFRRKGGANDKLFTLTTPIAYITCLMEDPFAPLPGQVYAYATPMDQAGKPGKPPGWIIWSPGPDGVYDLTGSLGEYDLSKPAPSPELLEKTYDPTNGSVSRGDIWRFSLQRK